MGQGPAVLAQQPGIGGFSLAKGGIQKFPPHRRPLLNKGKVVRRKYHGAEFANQRRGSRLVHPVKLGGPFFRPPADGNFRRLLPFLRLEIQRQHSAGLGGKGDQLLIPGAPEGPSPGKQPNRLQQIGFALGVIPADHVDLRPGDQLILF